MEEINKLKTELSSFQKTQFSPNVIKARDLIQSYLKWKPRVVVNDDYEGFGIDELDAAFKEIADDVPINDRSVVNIDWLEKYIKHNEVYGTIDKDAVNYLLAKICTDDRWFGRYMNPDLSCSELWIRPIIYDFLKDFVEEERLFVLGQHHRLAHDIYYKSQYKNIGHRDILGSQLKRLRILINDISITDKFDIYNDAIYLAQHPPYNKNGVVDDESFKLLIDNLEERINKNYEKKSNGLKAYKHPDISLDNG